MKSRLLWSRHCKAPSFYRRPSEVRSQSSASRSSSSRRSCVEQVAARPGVECLTTGTGCAINRLLLGNNGHMSVLWREAINRDMTDVVHQLPVADHRCHRQPRRRRPSHQRTHEYASRSSHRFWQPRRRSRIRRHPRARRPRREPGPHRGRILPDQSQRPHSRAGDLCDPPRAPRGS
jgi:hypothetical protein